MHRNGGPSNWCRLEHLSLDVTYAGTIPIPILGADVTPALRDVSLRFVTRQGNEGIGAAAALS